MSVDGAAGLQKILLVEDDMLIREMYQLFLQEKGFTVDVAVDGEDALRVAKNFQPDLIFLDIMMPKMDGLQVLKILRADASYGCQKCRIVLLTNLGDDSIADSVKHEADGYAIKAEITLNDLVSIIHSFGQPTHTA